ncbi:hypothetical protein KAH94_03955 [bacterium]|nr:hypothetical protein [bacterium]
MKIKIYFLCMILGINSTSFSMGLLARLIGGFARKQEKISINSNFNNTFMCPISDDKSFHYKAIEKHFGQDVANDITKQPGFLQKNLDSDNVNWFIEFRKKLKNMDICGLRRVANTKVICDLKDAALPDKNTLEKRLKENSFGDFVEKTKINEILSCRIISYREILDELEGAMASYEELVPWSEAMKMYNKGHKLVKVILQDYPKKIESLEKCLQALW